MTRGHSLSISMSFHSEGQPNHFGAPVAAKRTFKTPGFLGSTRRGGSCYVEELTVVPHCNGTHTECVGHIVDDDFFMTSCDVKTLLPCYLMTLTPKRFEGLPEPESYPMSNIQDDLVLSRADLKNALSDALIPNFQALVIRTAPNHPEKKVKVYTDKEKVPYFTNEAMQMIDRLGINHLLVDLPSIDRGNDDGRLSNHRIYWRQPADFHSIMKETMTNRTITEMIYVDDFIDDGLYLLNIQFPAIETDAVPSRPIIYPTEQL